MALLYVANNGFSCHLPTKRKSFHLLGMLQFNVRVQLSSFCFSSRFFNDLAGLQVRDFWGMVFHRRCDL